MVHSMVFSAVLVLVVQFSPILSALKFKILVHVCAGSVVLDRFLHRLALQDALAEAKKLLGLLTALSVGV
jgi:hypothetical protein